MKRWLILAAALTYAIAVQAEVTPLDNEDLKTHAVSQPGKPNPDQVIEELEALQDQQRMLPDAESRLTLTPTVPEASPPPQQQEFLNTIIDNINDLRPPPPLP